MSDNFNLLSICGPDLIQYVEGIDFESFVNLKPDQIKEAIPNVIHRIMFENRFKNYLKSFEGGKETSQLMTFIESDEVDGPIFDESFDLINVVTPSTSAITKSIPSSQKPLKKPTVIKTIQDIIDVPNIKLKIIIMKFADKMIPMENYDRILIGKAIIHHLMVHDFERKVQKNEYSRLAELIVQLFPFESEGTFYTPAVKGNPAQGKLYSAYQNYRTELIEAGLIAKRERSLSEEREEEEALDQGAQHKSDALKLVLENNDDFDQTKIAWKLCYNERQTLVNELSTFEYMRRFPAFNLPTGFELLILDADALYPNKQTKLFEIAPKIVSYGSLASKKKKSPVELQNLVVEYDESVVGIDENSHEFHTLQQITALRLLPHLMPNPKRKLSKSEVANCFCPYFKTSYEADSFNTKFNRDNKDSTIILKPRLYLVGTLRQPSATIWIGNNNYTHNALSGFELLFKSYLALKSQYPDETKHIWQFIQEEVYEIETGEDNQLASVRTFIKDLKYFINKSI